MNKYQIGDLVEFTDGHNQTKLGAIYLIKALTDRRYNKEAQQLRSKIIPEAIGYRCIGHEAQIPEKDIIRLVAKNRLE